jgi:hypothetical protein
MAAHPSSFETEKKQEWLQKNSHSDKCILCNINLASASALIRHLETKHLQHAIEVEGNFHRTVAVCLLKCKVLSKQDRHGHYHCPCGEIIRKKNKFVKHITTSKHHRKLKLQYSSPETANAGSATPEASVRHSESADNLRREEGNNMLHEEPSLNAVPVNADIIPQVEISMAAQREKIFPARLHNLKQGQCPICDKIMRQKNVNQHLRMVHKILPPADVAQSCLVDHTEGLYMVSKHIKNDITPIHVVKKLVAVEHKIFTAKIQNAMIRQLSSLVVMIPHTHADISWH